MMKNLGRLIAVYFLVVIVLMGCATTKKTSTTVATGAGYSEDLSVLRPKVETVTSDSKTPVTKTGQKQTVYVEPRFSVNKKLDAVLDSIDRINVQRNFIDGFTIQVYSGLKKEEALNAKKELAATLPELVTEVQYAQPNFRVKVGKYFSRIDAQRDYLDVKRLFPTAIVIPDKVAIN